MKLSSLIVQANKTYALELSHHDVRNIYRRMKSAGYGDEVKSVAGPLDAILRTARRKPRAQSIYASMKREIVASTDHCPRCHQTLRVVALLQDRRAHYCQGCAITLPIKV